MRSIFIFIAVLLISCNNNEQQKASNRDSSKKENVDSTPVTNSGKNQEKELDTTRPVIVNNYSNKWFKDVMVEHLGAGKYMITGKAQVFEAAFSWEVEDGHNQLLAGHETTDAGAPEFGNFSFDITVKKKQENSTLTLTLYEASAKDGSRQHELHIPLK